VTDNSTGELWAAGPPAGSWRRYLVADVFTASPLQGNQLGVFPDGRGLDGALMQRTARELNLSETVFFLPSGQGCDARVRIFTPVGELPFAGHPVLGSAAGPLAVHLARHGRIGFGEEIEIRQGEEIGRPSVLYARAVGTADRIERVLVGGSAVIVARGEYLIG
jgi:predicted PhzF superfamily epimerase YddE/YHI9